MRAVRRIERAAEQTDAHAVGMERDGLGGLRRDRNSIQLNHRAQSRFFEAFSSREPIPTADRVRSRLSLENAAAVHGRVCPVP
jgi:hypothetical protein